MGLILGCREKEKRSNLLVSNLLERLFCGERGIRTPGTFQCGSFQDCCNRPLYHLSFLVTTEIIGGSDVFGCKDSAF